MIFKKIIKSTAIFFCIALCFSVTACNNPSREEIDIITHNSTAPIIADFEIRTENGDLVVDTLNTVSVELYPDEVMKKIGVRVKLTADGQSLFAKATKDNIGKTLEVYIDGEFISAPKIYDEITGDEFIIYCDDRNEAEEIFKSLTEK